MIKPTIERIPQSRIPYQNQSPQFLQGDNRYRMLFNNVAAGLAFIHSRSGCFIKANQHYGDMLGYDSGEMSELGINDIIHPDDFWNDWNSRSKIEKGDIREYVGEVRYRHKNGSYVWVNVKTAAGWQSGESPGLLVVVAEDISARIKKQKMLTFLAEYDQLTQLPNRSLFRDRLKLALSRSRRHHCPTGLIYIDLDGFKPINDQYGHHLGDSLLKAVAKRMLIAVRETDTVARIHGDEFVVIVEDLASRAEATDIAEKIKQAMHPCFVIDGLTINIDLSVGYAIYPDDTYDLDDLIIKADQAMYRDKHSK